VARRMRALPGGGMEMAEKTTGIKISNNDKGRFSRRRFLKGVSLAAVATGIGSGLAKTVAAQTPSSQTGAVGGLGGSADSKLFYVVETTSGKVQGIASAGIKQFKGIPYGASTAGKNRFMPPKKPASWTGIRECIGLSQVCPQVPSDLRSDYG